MDFEAFVFYFLWCHSEEWHHKHGWLSLMDDQTIAAAIQDGEFWAAQMDVEWNGYRLEESGQMSFI